MKKSPPTLADACIATALDKNLAGRGGQLNDEARNRMMQIAQARRFVLDTPMSSYLHDLSWSFWTGGQRKRLHRLDNARQMARLPHRLTWVEFDLLAYYNRAKQQGIDVKYMGKMPGEPDCKRAGWLLRQHDKIETAFIASEVHASIIIPDRATMHPVSICWTSDDTPLPWITFELWRNEPSGLAVQMAGYDCKQVGWTYTYSPEFSSQMMYGVQKSAPASIKPDLSIRDLWALLATINDLPVRIEPVRPDKGYIARGSYRKFLSHSVVHLTVPESKWSRLVNKTANLLRRRAHQVRGHWRRDWRNPLNPLCEHEFDAAMVCRRCSGHKLWIAEHQRGDASLGFVTHDYEVHHARP
jgi:hypothetical protein